MKVAKLYSADDIRVEEMSIPKIGPREALVRMKACGICTGDIVPWYIERKAPLVFGHEPAGVIEKIGEELTDFKVGDRVFIHHHAPCMLCEECRKGRYVHCKTWRETSLDPGGMAEFVRIPEINLRYDTLKLPEGISFYDGALVEPTATVIKSLKRAEINPGETMAVIGLGVMGQLHVILSRQFGIREVFGLDMVPFRLKKALDFGASAVVDVKREDPKEKIAEFTSGVMADTVVVGPASIEAIEEGLQIVASGGRLILFTPTHPERVWRLKPYEIYMREISIIPSYSAGPYETREALKWIESGIVSAEKLVTHRFPLGDVKKAYSIAREARDCLKVMIDFEL